MNLNKIYSFIISKKNLFVIITISILALLLRLLNLGIEMRFDTDEISTYAFSLGDTPLDVLKTILKYDFHMPSYYVFLNIWMKTFGTSDFYLRLSSVFWGVLSIPAAFFFGKSYKDEKLGYLYSLFLALSPIAILFSQELRFYSMLIFFSILSFTFLVRVLTVFSKKDIIYFYIVNLVILSFYSAAPVLLVPQLIVLFYDFFKNKRQHFKFFLHSTIVFFLLSLPFFCLIFYNYKMSLSSLMSPLGKSNFRLSSILYIFNDWFSPLLRGIYWHATFYGVFFKDLSLFPFLLYLSLTTVCFISGVIRNFFKRTRINSYFIFIAIFGLLIDLVLMKLSIMTPATKYTLGIFPLFLLLATSGILSFSNTKIQKILIFVIIFFFSLNIYRFNSSYTYNRKSPVLGVAQKLEKINFKKGDLIFFPGCDSAILAKYFPDVMIIDLFPYKIISLDKSRTEIYKIFDENFDIEASYSYKKKPIVDFVKNPQPSINLRKYINTYLDSAPKGSRLIAYIPTVEKFNKSIQEINYDSSKYAISYVLPKKIFSDLLSVIKQNQNFVLQDNALFGINDLYLFEKK